MNQDMCAFCKNTFTKRSSLERHIKEYRCKNTLSSDLLAWHDTYTRMLSRIEYKMNTLDTLDVSYIETDKMKSLLEGNFFISKYMKEIFCNPDHPENHIIKYKTTNPAIYSIDNVEYCLDDACDVLLKPVKELFDFKLREFMSSNTDENLLKIYNKRHRFLFLSDEIREQLTKLLQTTIISDKLFKS